MKTVLLLGGPAAGQRVEVHGSMLAVEWSEILPFNGAQQPTGKTVRYQVVPMCSHGEVHWFGVLDGADPLALLIAGYGMDMVPKAGQCAHAWVRQDAWGFPGFAYKCRLCSAQRVAPSELTT